MAQDTSNKPPVSVPFYHKIDWAFIVLLILCAFSLRPLIGTEGLPNGPDVLYHTYRTAEMARSWEHGVFFPRWAEGTYFGYGSPLFHYYASLTYYVGSALMLVAGMTALETMRAFIVITLYGSAIGMYGFLRGGMMGRRISKLGALMGALAYVYAPYMVFTEPYGRGAYPELLALALFPWVMWAFTQTLTTRRGGVAVLAMVSLYLLIISHNLMALVLTGVLVGWLMWHAVADVVAHASTGRGGWRDALRPYALAGACVVGGLMLGAHFWLPALGETWAINLANVTAVPELDYRNRFAILPDLFGFHPRMDEGAINGLRHEVVTLGVSQWILALTGFITTLGAIGIAIRRGLRDDVLLRQAVYFGLVGALMTFLMVPPSLFIWELITPLEILQFPWRFLGPVAFLFAVLVAMNSLWLERLPARLQTLGVTVAISALLLTSFTALYVPEWTNEQVDASIGGYLQAELDGRQRGTTYTDEYRPIAVKTPPDETPRLITDYMDGYPIDKANVPEGVSVTLLDNNPHSSRWQVVADEPFTFEKLTYDWLGWVAEVDGERVEIVPSQEHGLITFDVPAGEHIVHVYLGTTPLRSAGMVISIMGLVVMFFIGARFRGMSAPQTPLITPTPTRYGIASGLAVVLLAGAIFLRDGMAWLNTPAGQAPASVPTDYVLDDFIHLLGYDLGNRAYRAGDTLRLNLYWYGERETDVDFLVFVHISQGGIPIAQNDNHPGGRVTSEWLFPTGYLLDEHRISLPVDMPAGEYTIYVGMYTCDLMPPDNCGNGYRPTVTRPDGSVVGDVIALETISVR